MKNYITIDIEKCKGCKYCLAACNFGLLRMSEDINSSGYKYAVYIDPDNKCTGCRLCAMVCPDIAIKVYKED